MVKFVDYTLFPLATNNVQLKFMEEEMKTGVKLFLFLAVAFFAAHNLFAKDISTNLKAAYLESDVLAKNLKDAGFKVIGGHNVAGSGKYSVLIITSKELQKFGRRDKRGFVSVLRILINKKEKELVVTNPEYFLRAFMEKDYKGGMEKPVADMLAKALGTLTPTDDKLEDDDIGDYHFMIGMPYYHEFLEVGEGKVDDLLGKLEAKAKSRIRFKLNLSSGGKKRYLIGVSLPKKIEKFNRTLGTMNKSHLLPYMVLLEGGKAKIMHAKYFLAISFPKLSMGQFMKISDIPGEIEDNFEAIFK